MPSMSEDEVRGELRYAFCVGVVTGLGCAALCSVLGYVAWWLS